MLLLPIVALLSIYGIETALAAPAPCKTGDPNVKSATNEIPRPFYYIFKSIPKFKNDAPAELLPVITKETFFAYIEYTKELRLTGSDRTYFAAKEDDISNFLGALKIREKDGKAVLYRSFDNNVEEGRPLDYNKLGVIGQFRRGVTPQEILVTTRQSTFWYERHPKPTRVRVYKDNNEISGNNFGRELDLNDQTQSSIDIPEPPLAGTKSKGLKKSSSLMSLNIEESSRSPQVFEVDNPLKAIKALGRTKTLGEKGFKAYFNAREEDDFNKFSTSEQDSSEGDSLNSLNVFRSGADKSPDNVSRRTPLFVTKTRSDSRKKGRLSTIKNQTSPKKPAQVYTLDIEQRNMGMDYLNSRTLAENFLDE